jgi:hypothetical protein
MKISPVNIQSYQQPPGNDRANAASKSEKKTLSPAEKVAIEPRVRKVGSELAVKVSAGSHAEFLSPEERRALDMLFGKYADSIRSGSASGIDTDARNAEELIGRIIDVKV